MAPTADWANRVQDELAAAIAGPAPEPPPGVLADPIAAALPALGVPRGGLDRALRAVLLERACQAQQHGGAEHDDGLSPLDWMARMARQHGLANAAAGTFELGEFRGRLVRLAALALAAIESGDRKAARRAGGRS